MESMGNTMNLDMKASTAAILAVAAYAGYRVTKGVFDKIGCFIDEAKAKIAEAKAEAENAKTAEGA